MFNTRMNVAPITTEDVLRISNTFLPAPHILLQLGNLLRNPTVDLEEITSRLRRDPALTAQLIRIANSAAFASAEPVSSVEDAVTLIGFEEVHRIVGFAMLERLGDGNLPVYGISGKRYMENSLFAALLMEELSAGKQVDPRSCYTVGLLRSIGKVCLDRLARNWPLEDMPMLTDDLRLADWERLVFGQSSNETAGIILKAWRFPEEFISAISDHYEPDERDMPLTHLLNLASSMSDILGYGLEGEWRYWLDSEQVYHKAGLDQKQADVVIDHAFDSFRRLMKTM